MRAVGYEHSALPILDNQWGHARRVEKTFPQALNPSLPAIRRLPDVHVRLRTANAYQIGDAGFDGPSKPASLCAQVLQDEVGLSAYCIRLGPILRPRQTRVMLLLSAVGL